VGGAERSALAGAAKERHPGLPDEPVVGVHVVQTGAPRRPVPRGLEQRPPAGEQVDERVGAGQHVPRRQLLLDLQAGKGRDAHCAPQQAAKPTSGRTLVVARSDSENILYSV